MKEVENVCKPITMRLYVGSGGYPAGFPNTNRSFPNSGSGGAGSGVGGQGPIIDEVD